MNFITYILDLIKNNMGPYIPLYLIHPSISFIDFGVVTVKNSSIVCKMVLLVFVTQE